MATLNATHINPFLMAAKKIFQEMCFVDVEIQKPLLSEAEFKVNSWVIIIGVTGEVRGQVFIGMDEETACAIASKMCMMDVKEIDDFAASALGELGNMIMGNTATIFSSNNIGIDITPPTLSRGNIVFKSSYSKVLCVPMLFEGRPIRMFLSLRQD